MMKAANYLLPRYFKFIGFGMLIPLIGLSMHRFFSVIMGDIVGSVMRPLQATYPAWMETYYALLRCFDGGWLDLSLRLGWPFALLFIAFAREKVEDEYIWQIRMQSLVWALILDGVLIVLATLVLYRMDYLIFMGLSFYVVILLYMLRFRAAIYCLNSNREHEE